MEARVLIFSGCKLISIYWAVYALNHISGLSMFLFPIFDDSVSQESEARMVQVFIINIVPLVIYFGLSIFLWFFSEKITNLALRDTNPSIKNVPINESFVLKALFAVTGLFVALLAVPDLAKNIYAYNQLEPIIQTSQTGWDQKGTILGESLQLILGVSVLFGAKGLSNAVVSLREMGNK